MSADDARAGTYESPCEAGRPAHATTRPGLGLYVYDCGRYRRSGGDHCVVVAASEKRARELLDHGDDYVVLPIGVAFASQSEGVVLFAHWEP